MFDHVPYWIEYVDNLVSNYESNVLTKELGFRTRGLEIDARLHRVETRYSNILKICGRDPLSFWASTLDPQVSKHSLNLEQPRKSQRQMTRRSSIHQFVGKALWQDILTHSRCVWTLHRSVSVWYGNTYESPWARVHSASIDLSQRTSYSCERTIGPPP